MATVISHVPRDQVGGQSRPGRGVSIFSGLELDFEVFPSQDVVGSSGGVRCFISEGSPEDPQCRPVKEMEFEDEI